MRRVFDPDVLACPRYGGRLRLIATAENPPLVGTILGHLGPLRPADLPGPAPLSADRQHRPCWMLEEVRRARPMLESLRDTP